MKRLSGLIAATFTPMDDQCAINVEPIQSMVDSLVDQGVNGLYVCGSTGEGPSLTTQERQIVAESFVRAADGRIPVVVQVGHNSIEDARALAKHAEEVGADAISAVPPTYFKPNNLSELVDTLEPVTAAASQTPFYYYHIPVLSGLGFDMPEFLKMARAQIPTLAGIKFSSRDLDMMQQCQRVDDGRFNILFGVDEMLLSGLAAGCDGAVGSTYNFLAPLFQNVKKFFDSGDLPAARAAQAKAIDIIQVLISYGGNPGLKAAMSLSGHPCGPTRLPLKAVRGERLEQLKKELDALGFSECTSIGAHSNA